VVRSELQLLAQDAVPLAHALSEHVARGLGTRALAIKGPSATHHALREARLSADADIWVEPSGFELFIAALEDRGWHGRVGTEVSRELTEHSVTLIHGEWPCDIDVHREFPGLLAPAVTVFEELWAGRVYLQQACVDIAVPGLAGAILIAALHAIRTPAQSPRHASEFRQLTARCEFLTPLQREDLAELAAKVNALDTARPFLDSLGIRLPGPTPYGVSPALDEWRARIAADGSRAAKRWIVVARRPLRQRPAAIWRVLWPPEQDLRQDNPIIPSGRIALNWARTRRLLHVARQVPATARGRLAARRGVSRSSIADQPK